MKVIKWFGFVGFGLTLYKKKLTLTIVPSIKLVAGKLELRYILANGFNLVLMVLIKLTWLTVLKSFSDC